MLIKSHESLKVWSLNYRKVKNLKLTLLAAALTVCYRSLIKWLIKKNKVT